MGIGRNKSIKVFNQNRKCHYETIYIKRIRDIWLIIEQILQLKKTLNKQCKIANANQYAGNHNIIK